MWSTQLHTIQEENKKVERHMVCRMGNVIGYSEEMKHSRNEQNQDSVRPHCLRHK
jgi:hypothetical protein